MQNTIPLANNTEIIDPSFIDAYLLLATNGCIFNERQKDLFNVEELVQNFLEAAGFTVLQKT